MNKLAPQVFLDHHGRPLIVFAKGRTLYHAVKADTTITLETLETLRGLREAFYKDKPYAPSRCASYWLNHSTREITKRAKLVLRGLVARKPREPAQVTPCL